MDIMDQLKNMVEASEAELPFRHDQVRKNLDFQVIPQMVYEDGEAFVGRCLKYGEEYVCGMFNTYYAKMNPIHYRDDPKHFAPGDFRVGGLKISEDQRLLYMGIPEETGHSREFCRAYVLTWVKREERLEDIRFYAIMDSDYGWLRLGQVSRDGEVKMVGRASGNLKEDLDRIAKIAFGE